MDQMINVIPSYEHSANGDVIILVYDIFVFLLFLFDLLLYKNKEDYMKKIKEKNKTIQPFQKFFVSLAHGYDRHGLMTVTLILYITSLLTILSHHKIVAIEFGVITFVFILFFLFLYLVKRFFMGIDQFQNEIISRLVDLIFYLILGHGFVLFATFIKTPQLPLGLIGLLFGLVLCFNIMLKAISNPNVLMHSVSKRRKYKESAGILKGMLALIFFELALMFLMVYNCFKVNSGFYSKSDQSVLDTFDLFYYLITSFATIGYGDIHPVRFNAEIYSELVAIVIALASMFSTACFVGAVVSGASEISRKSREDKKRNDS